MQQEGICTGPVVFPTFPANSVGVGPSRAFALDRNASANPVGVGPSRQFALGAFARYVILTHRSGGPEEILPGHRIYV